MGLLSLRPWPNITCLDSFMRVSSTMSYTWGWLKTHVKTRNQNDSECKSSNITMSKWLSLSVCFMICRFHCVPAIVKQQRVKDGEWKQEKDRQRKRRNRNVSYCSWSVSSMLAITDFDTLYVIIVLFLQFCFSGWYFDAFHSFDIPYKWYGSWHLCTTIDELPFGAQEKTASHLKQEACTKIFLTHTATYTHTKIFCDKKCRQLCSRNDTSDQKNKRKNVR